MESLYYFNQIWDGALLARIQSRGNEAGQACLLTHPAYELARYELDKYLGVAFRHGIIDETLKKRLRSSSWETFYQVVAELKTAYFLEQILGQKIEFYPAGRGKKNGDIAILTQDGKIFVEVKAPWEEPWPSGARSFDNATRIKRCLKKAYSQIPEGLPSLVVIAGWFNVSLTLKNVGGMEKALYGRSVIMVPIAATGDIIGSSRVRDGFFQLRQNRRLSAVALLEEKLPTKAEYQFQVYHNPHAYMKISHDLFGGQDQITFDHERREIRRLAM